MLNEFPSDETPPEKKSPSKEKLSAQKDQEALSEKEIYLEERIRKTLRLHIVALKINGLFKH